MRLLAFAFWVSLAAPAVAQCYPPPGLSPQQWYSVCGGTMEDGFARGMGAGMPHDDFMMMMYRMYATGGPGGPAQPQPGAGFQQCSLGAVQCFNGWVRRCEARGYSAMWITGAERCR